MIQRYTISVVIIGKLNNSMKQRSIKRITANPPQPGFLGEGHIATAVVDGSRFSETDPFIFLMDDKLNLPGGEPVGGPHPHAGFETVTFILEGNPPHWKEGSVEIMTAGKGIVHTEEISAKTDARILQLWLALPPEKRWTEPFFQEILLEDVPVLKTDDYEIRVYSGSSNGITSPMENQTPFTLVDVKMNEKSEFVQELPASYNGFIYVVKGSVSVGDRKIENGQTAWFDRPEEKGNTEVVFNTSGESTRFILYAALPHHVPIVSHGPFIADTEDDIRRLYREFRQGKMPHLRDLPAEKKLHHV